MASVRFAGLIIGAIIVSLALKYSTACAYEGSRRKGKWLAGIAPQSHAPSKNDLSDETSAAEVANIAGRKGVGGSEMQVDKLSNTERENQLGSDKRKISGNYASIMDSEEAAQHYHLMKAQVNSKMSKQPRQKSRASSSHEDASKAFLEAADEVVNLMRKDYSGKDHPRRKPPINNHEPTD